MSKQCKKKKGKYSIRYLKKKTVVFLNSVDLFKAFITYTKPDFIQDKQRDRKQ